MKRIIGIILISAGVILLIAGINRGFFYSPNDAIGEEEVGEPDSGLVLGGEATGSQANTAQSPVSKSKLPSRLIIPKLDIDANVQALGQTRKGNMAAPNNFTDVSWYKLGTLPGQVGSAVMAGHEDNAVSLDGVFKHLEDLKPGDDVYVTSGDGAKLHFKVTGSEIYPYDNSPVEKIFATSDKARLNLITCAGNWIQSAKTNDKRLVVYTVLVE